jgi:hypothetical protein
MAITFGNTSAPSNITTYLDSVFAQSIANYRKQLIDNIGASNALLYEILKSDAYEEADGGTFIAENLMYALAPADSYDGYDELSTLPTDGITQAVFQWRQMASPIVYSMKEVIQNEHKLIDLVKSRIMQSELGIQEGWAQAFMWGAYPQGSNIYTARSSPVNGSLGIDPLPLIVYAGTGVTFGNIADTNTWWQNHYTQSASTTFSGFMLDLEQMYNSCALGTGGPPTLILMDQVTYQTFIHAYFSIYKASPDQLDGAYPFIGKKFLNAKVVMDDKVPDAYSNTAGSATQAGGVVPTTATTYGTAYFLNTKFFKVRYHPARDWTLLQDENGKHFVKPINGDSRVGHVAWMGNVTCNNRRKQGVLYHISKSITS